MRIGIIGYGSIGKRHVRNLTTLGIRDILLLRTKRLGNEYGLKELESFDELIKSNPDAFVISNPSSLHFKFLATLLNENKNVLVEKPLVALHKDLKKIRLLLTNYGGFGMAAFNMRFHPVVCKAMEWLNDNKLGQILSARFFVGQYLPDWRPGQDYRYSYSASQEMGGGVILDLIHELDLAVYLIGLPSENVSSRINRLSHLDINTEDLAEVLYNTENGTIVSVHMDYLTYGYKRYFELIGSRGTITADLFKNKIQLQTKRGLMSKLKFKKFKRNDTYLKMMKSFTDGIRGNISISVPLDDVLDVNEMALALRDGKTYGK